jgi:hypothetical protein
VLNCSSQLIHPQERTRFSQNRGWLLTIGNLEVLAKRNIYCTLLQFKPWVIQPVPYATLMEPKYVDISGHKKKWTNHCMYRVSHYLPNPAVL